MKIFIPKINVNMLNLKLIEDIDISNKDNVQFNYIYSNEGIFLADKKGVQKLIFKNEIVKERKLNDLDILIDYTKIEKQKDITHIPDKSITFKIVQHKLMLRRQSKIWLIIESNNKNILDFYLETFEDIDNFSIKEDFTTLISNLRNIIDI
tara:strand:+ start:208 stop:660 length:453 start_codon:yes stop_codon:yes gene_type:complete